MITEILLAVVQGASEFLPISSSGHLALVSNLISSPNVFFFTVLHLASLLAVLIFTRNEIVDLFRFDSSARRMWGYLIVATIPAAAVGYFFNDFIEGAFSSYLFLGVAFIFTGGVLLMTKFFSGRREMDLKSCVLIGLFQALALFPGVSRSGMTISSGMFMGLSREKVAKFSFLLFIPLALGAFVLEFETGVFSLAIGVSFLVCLFVSLLFLNLLMRIIVQNKFWMFSVYCFVVGIVSLVLGILL